jgi:DNA phosphorothioation-associated putative methyltransferase
MRHRVDPKATAIRRRALSRPIKLAVTEGLVSPERTFFDYGCGLGDDVQRLRELGIPADGWDPGHQPDADLREASIVNLGFVLNVLANDRERRAVLKRAWTLTGDALVVSARLSHDRRDLQGVNHRDGIVTNKGTFQKFFEQTELRRLLQETLETEVVSAAPGVFYAFRNEALRQSCLAQRQHRRVTTPKVRQSDKLFEQYRKLLETLMAFYTERGRLPDMAELPEASEIAQRLGSVRQAFSVIRRVTGSDGWKAIESARRSDLLVYLALARLSGRARFSELSRQLQLDIRAHYGAYTRACEEANALLYSAGNIERVLEISEEMSFGKRTPHAVYVHGSALAYLPPLLRVYEGSARHYVGHVEDANIIKLHRHRSQVSYLSYPRFEQDPHPALVESLVVSLDTLSIYWTDYRERDNPPILHRKEVFLDPSHPLHGRFARLTAQEERFGLLEDTTKIGTRNGWEERLRESSLQIRGHRLVRTKDE